MKKKVSKLMFVFVVPILACLSLGVFLAGGLVSGYASALAQNGGSAYVRTGSTMSVGDETAISDFSAVNGGGVYVTSGGTLTMSGGTIAGNTATSGSGHNVYNAGTFTMSGGTVGKSGNAKTYGIYNTGTMKLLGGTVYDDIYSSSTFTTSPSATLNGTIALSNSATITVQNYAGTTPILKISLSSSRTDGTIVKFQGSTTQPSLSRLTVSGFDSATYELDIVQGSSSTEWNVVLKKQAVDFPRDWKTQIASTTYMTTTVDDPKTLTSITFEVTVPSGYTQIGTLSTGLKVYQSSSDATKIAFVNRGNIFAPENSSSLFWNLSVSTLTFNNFNTSNVTSMNWMFSVQEVKNIDLSCFDTSKVEDFSFFFHECSILETITLGENFNTSSATNMECMFSYCPKLQSLDVRGFDTSKVTNMRNMFAGLNIVQGLDVSGFNTSKVTDMGGMFSGCSGLTSLNVGNFNTANVTTMGSMFSGCSGLTSLDVSGFDTSKVIYMYSMFYGCSSLISLNLSNFNTSSVTSMVYMFGNCSGLTSLNLSNFNTANVTDMEAMFRGCTGLTSLNLSNFNTANVTDMEAMFYNCSSLTSLDLSRFDTSKVVIENYETSYFPFYGMFENCSSLKSLNVDNFNTLGMKCMDKMFKNCSSLTSLNLSSFDMTNVTSCTDMLNFGTSAVLKHLKTPYNNSVALPITKGNALYDVSTGDPVSSVPANLTSSKTYATRFTITFDANGGSCSESSRTAYYGVDVGDLPTPTRSGYTFDGWFDGSSRVSGSSSFTAGKTLQAHWSVISTPDPDPDPEPPPPSSGPGIFPSDWESQLADMNINMNYVSYILFASASNFESGNYTCYGDIDGIYCYYSEPEEELVFWFEGVITPDPNCSQLFYSLSHVKGIVFRNFDTYNVYDMSLMFAGCTELEFVDLYSFETPNVTTMCEMFMECTSLKGVYNAVFDCYSLYDCSRMFESCFAFTGESANFGDEDVSGMPVLRDSYRLENMSNMFYQCESLVTFSMPYMHTQNVSSASGMFGSCSSLQFLDLSNFILGNCESDSLIDEYVVNLNLLFTPRLADLSQFADLELYTPYGYTLSETFDCPGIDMSSVRPAFSISLASQYWIDESGLFPADISLYTFNSFDQAFFDSYESCAGFLFNEDSFSSQNITIKVFPFFSLLRYYTLPIPWENVENLRSFEGLSMESFCGWSTDGGTIDQYEYDRLSQDDFLGYMSRIDLFFDYNMTLTARNANVEGDTYSIYFDGVEYEPSDSPYGTWDGSTYLTHNLYVCSWFGYFPTPHLENGAKFEGWNLYDDGTMYHYYSYYKNLTLGNHDWFFVTISSDQNNGTNTNGITKPTFADSDGQSFLASAVSKTGEEKTVELEMNEELQAILEDEKKRYFATKQEDLDDDSDGGEKKD